MFLIIFAMSFYGFQIKVILYSFIVKLKKIRIKFIDMKSSLSVSFSSKVQHCLPCRYSKEDEDGRDLHPDAVDGLILFRIDH